MGIIGVPPAVESGIRKAMNDRGLVDRRTRFALATAFARLPIAVATFNVANDGVNSGAEAQAILRSQPELFLSGTGSSSAFNAGGGVTISTGATSTNVAGLGSLGVTITGVNSGNPFDATGWNATAWKSQKRPAFEMIIAIPTITTVSVICGLAEYGTTIPVANELAAGLGANAAVFAFETASSVSASKWRGVQRVGGTSTDTRVLGDTVAADTIYQLRVELADDRSPRWSINGIPAAYGTPLEDDKSLKPFLFIKTGANEARTANVYYLEMSRDL